MTRKMDAFGTEHNPAIQLTDQARALLEQSVEGLDGNYGLGSMSCSPYDTAWVSMVTKVFKGEKKWLFPESFHFLLETQSDDGSWGSNANAEIDGILNTAVSLLSLERHSRQPLQIHEPHPEVLTERMNAASTSLSLQLKKWRVMGTRHVGFELIVPTVLKLLQHEDPAYTFRFEGENKLRQLNSLKMSCFRPELLYGPSQVTSLHSLEAFIGKVDFDKIPRQRGSMMGSPAATSAYLMNATYWDDEAESYLRYVVRYGSGKGNGGVPSAFPSMLFEYSWVIILPMTLE